MLRGNNNSVNSFGRTAFIVFDGNLCFAVRTEIGECTVFSDDTLSEIVTETFDLRPAAIIDSLNLRRPIYRQLAAYGHMGRTDLDLPWEKTDKAVELKQAAGI